MATCSPSIATTQRPAAFARLGKGDAIFPVTVRPPDESLWLVAVLESPKQQGKAWVGTANKIPTRDITPHIKQLKFATGTGIKAKSGALAMSLQTPRVLTTEDVGLLRGGAEQFALTNIRKPFSSLKKLLKPQYAQLALLTANNDAGTPEQCVGDDEWSLMQLADVAAGSDAFYQLYVWGAGSGALFQADDTTLLATISQHAFTLTGDDDATLRRHLATACKALPAFASIDFSRAKPKKTSAEKTERQVQQAAMERLEKALGDSKIYRPNNKPPFARSIRASIHTNTSATLNVLASHREVHLPAGRASTRSDHSSSAPASGPFGNG